MILQVGHQATLGFAEECTCPHCSIVLDKLCIKASRWNNDKSRPVGELVMFETLDSYC